MMFESMRNTNALAVDVQPQGRSTLLKSGKSAFKCWRGGGCDPCRC